MKTKHFLFFYFFDDLTKTGYFNTGFVSLQYKNTNRYWPKCSNKLVENHIFFWKFFFWNLKFFTRPNPAQKGTGPKLARNKISLLSTGLDSIQPPRLGWYPSLKQHESGTVHECSNGGYCTQIVTRGYCTQIVTGLVYISIVTR